MQRDASDLRSIALENKHNYDANCLADIEKQALETARLGYNSITWMHPLNPPVLDLLRKKGYQVEIETIKSIKIYIITFYFVPNGMSLTVK